MAVSLMSPRRMFFWPVLAVNVINIMHVSIYTEVVEGGGGGGGGGGRLRR